MTATSNLLTKCVALGLSLCASWAWASGPAAVVLSGTGLAILGQLSGSTVRLEAEDLLKRARRAMADGNYALAEYYVDGVEKLDIKFDGLFKRFGDSPEKVRRDLAKVRSGNVDDIQPPSRRFSLPLIGKSATSASPSRGPTGPPTSGIDLSQLTNNTMTKARAFLDKGRMALIQGDLTSALGWYHNALATGAKFTPGEYSTEDLAAELRGAGVETSRLAGASDQNRRPATLTPQQAAQFGDRIPPALDQATRTLSALPQGQFISNPYAVSRNVTASHQVGGTSPKSQQTGPSERKNESLRLLAIAKAAMDRGELDRAEQLVRKAEQLNVDDSEYAQGDTRPWMLRMDIGRERRQPHAQVISPMAASTVSDEVPITQPLPRGPNDRPIPRPVRHEPADLPISQALPPKQGIRSGGALPRELDTRPAPRLTQLTPAPAAPTVQNGMQLFHLGRQALKRQDLDAARSYFSQAWSRRGDLDADSRQRLQDHLQLLNAPAAPASDGFSSPQSELDSTQQQLARVLYNQVTREQATIHRQRERDPRGAWRRLKQLRTKVAESEIDPTSRRQLVSRVDRSIEEMERFIEHNRARIELDEQNRQVLDDIERSRQQKLQVQQKLAEFVEEFNTLMEQQRFPEAVVVAKQARELDPLHPVVQNLVWKSQFARQFVSSMARRERTQAGALGSLDSVEDSAIPFDDRVAIEFPDVRFWDELTRRRRLLQERTNRYSEAELEIHQALKKQVDVNFENQPLSYVTNTLAQMAGVNVFLDPEGLKAEGVASDTTVTISLRKAVSLRSALNLILQPLRLSYIIQDEVLRITSEQERSGDVYPEVYNVADLVIPIPNFVPSYDMGLAGAIHEAIRTQGAGLLAGQVNAAPLAILAGNEGMGDASTQKSVLAQMGASGLLPNGARSAQPVGFGPGGLGGGVQADFDSLIELITTTVEPDSWDEVGGEGSIAPFETNLSLVVSTTQEIHEQIVDLLRQLRRLQDLQVTIEVRFITLSDNFFERIGVDFDFDIDDNTGLSSIQIEALDDDGPSITVGLDPNGNFTTDLDLQFSQNTLGATVPAFGGFDPGSAANFGFAILSDIEAFFVIQAAQGDSRTNVMQAPKVTLFNGQTASVTDNSQRPFVTSVIPVVGDFAAAHQPVITVLSEGTSLSVQAVVSPDRRFVRLTLVPLFSRIGDVDTFTFSGSTTTNTGTAAVDPSGGTTAVANEAQTITQGTTVQLPTFAITTISTTVSVPDGGTILLGGIKRLSEGRLERGLPLMSKLPYINRLFKNVGIGRETESLMMMVTPRIIIQEEEEERLGVSSP